MRFGAVALCLTMSSCASLPNLQRSEAIPCPPIPPPPPPPVYSAKCLELPAAMPLNPSPVLNADGTLDQLRTARGFVTELKSWGGIVLSNYTACVESHKDAQ